MPLFAPISFLSIRQNILLALVTLIAFKKRIGKNPIKIGKMHMKEEPFFTAEKYFNLDK